MRFYAREKEISILKENESQSKQNAVFTVLTGRMRVGKTTLLKTALEGCEYVYFPIYEDSEDVLSQKFHQTLEEELRIQIDETTTHFCDLLEVVLKESLNRHITIILDDFEALQKVDSTLFRKIKKLWNRYHHASHLHLITSCSIHLVTKRIFEDEKGQFYGRPSTILKLKPFTINVLKQILHIHRPDYQNEDLLCLYMITGGVPKYVELLMDAGCYTKEKMLDYVCSKDSYFLSEGKNIVNQLFGGKCVAYSFVLSLIASSLDTFHSNGTIMQRKLKVYLEDLEKDYQLVNCLQPLLFKSNNLVTAYEIPDQFLRFWFRFLSPYQFAIEHGNLSLLRENIEDNYKSFTGRTLEQYFRTLAKESGHYTLVGYWWSCQGKHEIDLVALNENNHTGLVAEIKRDHRKIKLKELKEKVNALPSQDFGDYKLMLRTLSIEDMQGLRDSFWNRWFGSIVRFLHSFFRHLKNVCKRTILLR